MTDIVERLRGDFLISPADVKQAATVIKTLRTENAALKETIAAALAVLPGQRFPDPANNLQRLVNLARGLLSDIPELSEEAKTMPADHRAENARLRDALGKAAVALGLTADWVERETGRAATAQGIRRDAAEARAVLAQEGETG